jgi:hypothetical protein
MSIYKDQEMKQGFVPTVTPKPNLPQAQPGATLPIDTGLNNILKAVHDDGNLGSQTLLKFSRGIYSTRDGEVALDSEAVVLVRELAREWIKFRNNTLVDRKIYRAALGERVPPREELDDFSPEEQRNWEKGLDGNPRDPWTFQYRLPMELIESAEMLCFVTGSIGGKRAVSDLVDAAARRLRVQPQLGNPVVKLGTLNMPTRYSKTGTPRPNFPIIGWNNEDRVVPDYPMTSQEELDDSIPY